jgi:hypothetical protein
MTKLATPLSKSWIARTSCLVVGLLASFAAAAQQSDGESNMVGRWSFSSPAQQGSPAYAGLLMFAPDGRAQLVMAGGSACVGGYQFDGETLTTAMSACQTCTGGYCMPAPDLLNYVQWSAPVQFQGPGSLIWQMQPPMFLHRN